MSLVTVPAINTNDDATADLFNSRFADIVAVLNGNIDSSNISTGSILYGDLALIDGDIPVAKINLTPGTSSGATREGGSAKIGTLLLQWGESDIITNTLVTFTQAYATNPQILLTPRGTNVASWVVSKSTTTFNASVATGTVPVGWLAIGKSA